MATAGDAFWLELQGQGQEQKGRRLVIVVQDDDAAMLSTRLCVPTSSSAGPSRWRVPVVLLGRDTSAMVDQLRAISLHRLAVPVDRVGYAELAEIRNAAWSLLGFLS